MIELQKSYKLIFIVGIGRSGTSLLQSMIAANPDVASLPETSFLRRMVFTGILEATRAREGVEAAEKRLESDRYFKRTGLDARSIINRASEWSPFLDVGVYLAMLAIYSDEGKLWIVDKDPRAIEFIRLIKDVVPDAHIIHVFRDPRDVLVSKKKALWSRNAHIWKHVFAGRVQFRIALQTGTRCFGDNYHEVKYESLISQPEKILSGLCTNIGLNYNSCMLSFGQAARRLVSVDELSWKKETFGSLLVNNSGKWKDQLRDKELMLCEACCSKVIGRGRYKKNRPSYRIELKDWLWCKFGSLLIIVATLPYILYRRFRVHFACRKLR